MTLLFNLPRVTLDNFCIYTGSIIFCPAEWKKKPTKCSQCSLSSVHLRTCIWRIPGAENWQHCVLKVYRTELDAQTDTDRRIGAREGPRGPRGLRGVMWGPAIVLYKNVSGEWQFTALFNRSCWVLTLEKKKLKSSCIVMNVLKSWLKYLPRSSNANNKTPQRLLKYYSHFTFIKINVLMLQVILKTHLWMPSTQFQECVGLAF